MKGEPVYILLADDDEGDRLIFKEAFSEIKIETIVLTVNNGVELMESLNVKGKSLPYLLFLDLNMIPKNGMECLKEIRSDDRLKDVFVAIYSTSNSEKDMDDAFNNGANIYITKPADFNILKQLLQKAVASALVYKGNKFDRSNFLLRI